MSAPVFHMLSNMPTYLRTLCHGDSVLAYEISLWDKPLCLAVGVRNAFWDTKRRALVVLYIWDGNIINVWWNAIFIFLYKC